MKSEITIHQKIICKAKTFFFSLYQQELPERHVFFFLDKMQYSYNTKQVITNYPYDNFQKYFVI